MTMDSEYVRHAVRDLGPWYHNIDLGGGVYTNPNAAGGDYPRVRWQTIEAMVPASLRGKRVLDIGCNAGFFAIEMKRRGADYVLGIDTMPSALEQARFVAGHLALDIDYRQLSVYELDSLNTTFDIVCFLGVLYHLRHPLLGLDKVAAICTDVAFIQSVVRGPDGDVDVCDDYPAEESQALLHPCFPRMCFIEHRYAGDATNWWIPNRNALVAMTRSAGFAVIQPTSDREVFACYKQPGAEGDEHQR